jgi:hypothetical protein
MMCLSKRRNCLLEVGGLSNGRCYFEMKMKMGVNGDRGGRLILFQKQVLLDDFLVFTDSFKTDAH